MEEAFYHQPVLLYPAIDYLLTRHDGIYVDCTLGGGGHSEEILKRLDGKGKLVCLDADPDAISFAGRRLASFPNKVIKQVFYDQLEVVLMEANLLPVHGVLFDFGISSFQVDSDRRGFSFQSDGPLDMRFNPGQKRSAAEVVNQYPVAKLEEIIREYGEERHWKKIAARIAGARSENSIGNTEALAGLIRSVTIPRHQNKTLARVFQAIRIEVNDELGRIKRALQQAFEVLQQNGRIVTLSYHSLEDKLVKEFFREKEIDCICPEDFPTCVCDKIQEMRPLFRKPVTPEADEIRDNPRARSARMRAAEKIVKFGGGKSAG